MANTINRGSRGFLGFLRAKVGGQAPDSWETVVRPTIDMLPFIGSEFAEVFTDTGSNATTGPATVLEREVPSDEAWMIWTLHSEVYAATSAAAVSRRVELRISNMPGGTSLTLSTVTMTKALGDVGSAQFNLAPQGQLLLPPGCKIQTILQAGAGAVTSFYNQSGYYSAIKV